jgi:hypothetical protein
MSHDHELANLLDAAAGPATPPSDVLADLARGRAALRQSRARTLGRGVAGIGLASVLAVGAVQILHDPPAAPPTTAPLHHDAGIRLVDHVLEAGPYTFGKTPEGWTFQGQNDFVALIVPADGDISPRLDVFVGKIAVMLQSADAAPGPGPEDQTVTADGRTFWIGPGGDSTTVRTPTLPGEPTGEVLVQFPSATGWTQSEMVAFVGSVSVGPGARKGLG